MEEKKTLKKEKNKHNKCTLYNFTLCNNPSKSFHRCIKTEYTGHCLLLINKVQILHHAYRFALALEAYLWACGSVHWLRRLMKHIILKNN